MTTQTLDKSSDSFSNRSLSLERKKLASRLPWPPLSKVKYGSSTPPPLPAHMKVRIPMTATVASEKKTAPQPTAQTVQQIVDQAGLHTVCQEAACPNLGHCWSQKTATFMIMGDTCTRRCGFCNIATARPRALDPAEPRNLAAAVAQMQLRHAVITSVDRDDLPDLGAGHFAACITAVREACPQTRIEVLIPDFKARPHELQKIWQAGPDIINHNVETVPSLFRTICPQSNYQNSLEVLRLSAEAGFLTKSGLILGLGECLDEVRTTIKDMVANQVKLLTIGQYLQPTREHAPLKEYIKPEVFDSLRDFALDAGLKYVESGPLVRSSYHASDSFEELLKQIQGTDP